MVIACVQFTCVLKTGHNVCKGRIARPTYLKPPGDAMVERVGISNSRFGMPHASDGVKALTGLLARSISCSGSAHVPNDDLDQVSGGKES